jgi:hypothetical protein
MRFTSVPGEPLQPESTVTAATSLHAAVEIETTLMGSAPYADSGRSQCHPRFVTVIVVPARHWLQVQDV